jgi:hypothetical protein
MEVGQGPNWSSSAKEKNNTYEEHMFVNYKIVWWLANGKKFDVDKIIILPVSGTNANSGVVKLLTITHEMSEIRATTVANV